MLDEAIGWLGIVSMCGLGRSEGSEGQSVSGFWVMATSDQDLQGLQEFVDLIDLGWRRTL